jgi:hypothetical protein
MVSQPPNEDELNDDPWPTMKILNAQPPTSININTINNNLNTISNYQQQPDTQPQTPNTHNNEHSTLSIFERLRHFLYINFVLNKRSFILSILSYAADIILFVSLNLFLFSNKKFIYELSCSLTDTNNNNNNMIHFSTSTNMMKINYNLTTDLSTDNTNINVSIPRTNNMLSELEQPTKTLKQSYLSLQIIILFVFFICFILSYLIKLQFKYHRLALNMYDYDVEMNINNQDKDRDGIDSLASTTTGSHFSSSVNKKLSSLLKRILNRLFTKLASILLNFFFGYQFCQNCFIQQPNELNDGYSIFIHIFIMICVVFRCFIIFLNKKNSKNQLNHLNKLQQKQKDLFNDINNKQNHKYFYYYYSYLIRSNQIQCNQLKQHQNNQNTFRIFQMDDVSLFIGFISSLFHLFTFLKAFELVFVFLPLLFTLILLRFKSSLNAILNLSLIVMSLLIISSSNSFSSITDISSYYLEKKYMEPNTNNSPIVAKLLSPNNTTPNNENINISRNECNSYYDYHNIQNSSSIINLFSYNLLTFFCFLLTFYFKSILSIYYCTLTGLERWNLSFLCKLSFWRKLSIYVSFLVYLLFILTCTIALCIKLKNWSLLSLPFYLFISFIWACFQLLNTINLTHLMNKINDCFLLLNESNSLSQANSFENSSNHSKKSKSSQIYNNNNNNPVCSTNRNNRNSTLSQSSGNNNNNSKGSFKLKKFLQRFLSYDKLNMNDEIINEHMNVSNVPIHRILAYKGVRHLGSISYRISLYCFFQTILLAPFAFYTNSPITIGMYLITLILNFIWLSLLYQFPKSNSGTCIAHAIVAPPLILNIYNNGTLATNNSSTINTNNPFLSSLSKKSSTTNSSSGTYTTTTTSSTTGNSLLFLPFNYQQALTQRCTYLLNKIQMFLQFHLIENFGCDFASNGLNKDGLELKLRNFFQKRSNDGSYYNTYILYYCGPTSNLTDNFAFVDGNELGIEQICDIWKKVHLNDDIGFKDSNENDDMEKVIISANENENENENPNNNNGTGSASGSGSEEENKQDNQIENMKKKKINKDDITRKKEKKNYNSRLIIILDAENTSKSLNYIKTKLNEQNLYIALQTVKYNLNNSSGQCGLVKSTTTKSKGIENKLILGDKTFKSNAKQSLMGPGSPQTISGNFFDSYLNFGKFTLDWIKSNCNSSNINSYENENLHNQLEFINQNENFFYHNNDFDEEEENELMNKDHEDDDEDDDDDESNEYDLENTANGNSGAVDKHTIKTKKNISNANTTGNNNGKAHRDSSAFFYEAKCAFSRYWLDFNFETKNEKALAHDFNQFWNLYYPYLICKPLLKLLNCRIFYLRFNFIRKIIFTLRHIKNSMIPMHEYDTGHGFKIFNN